MLERSADRDANSNVAHVLCSLSLLSDGVDRANVECRVQIGSAEETEASALDIERWLNEWIHKIETVGSANGVERSFERELRGFSCLRIWTERDVERSAELDVRFRGAEPHRVTDVHLNVLERKILREITRRCGQELSIASEKRIDD